MLRIDLHRYLKRLKYLIKLTYLKQYQIQKVIDKDDRIIKVLRDRNNRF